MSDVNILFYKFSKNLNYFDFEQTKIFYILGWREYDGMIRFSYPRNHIYLNNGD